MADSCLRCNVCLPRPQFTLHPPEWMRRVTTTGRGSLRVTRRSSRRPHVNLICSPCHHVTTSRSTPTPSPRTCRLTSRSAPQPSMPTAAQATRTQACRAVHRRRAPPAGRMASPSQYPVGPYSPAGAHPSPKTTRQSSGPLLPPPPHSTILSTLTTTHSPLLPGPSPLPLRHVPFLPTHKSCQLYFANPYFANPVAQQERQRRCAAHGAQKHNARGRGIFAVAYICAGLQRLL